MLPLCKAEGIGVIPWSPLARGRLTRDFDEKTARTQTDEYGKTLYTANVEDRSSGRGARGGDCRGSAACRARKIALAWLLQKSEVTAPIIGATKLQHLDDAVAALSVTLSGKEIAALEEPYVPHPVVGFG